MRIAITGANGYIGQRLVRAAQRAGYDVLAMCRHQVSGPGISWIYYDLANQEPISLPSDIAILYHLAAQTDVKSSQNPIEERAAYLLINATASIHAKFVFISSQAARPDAPTAYGRVKWSIEQATLKAGGIVIRPGQVYGGPELGLFGALCKVVRRTPVLPSFIPPPLVQPIHIDDLANAMLACSSQAPASLVSIAASTPITFTEFLSAISRARTAHIPLYVPVPSGLVKLGMRVVGPTLRTLLGLDRLLSLFSLQYMDTAHDLTRLCLRVRPVSSGMSRSGGHRRELIGEGNAMLRYVLRDAPSKILVRRYVRAIESLKAGEPLLLPALFLRAPACVALIDRGNAISPHLRNELDWRLNAAMAIAEASPQGAARFMNAKPGYLRGAIALICVAISEFLLQTLQLLLRPLLSKLGKRHSQQIDWTEGHS